MRATTTIARFSGPMRTRLLARATARGWSSGLAGAAADEQGLPSAFPWREAPDNRVQGLLNRALYASMQNSHRKILGLVENVHGDEAFLPAAEMAFVQVAAGVFQMRASQVVALLVEEGASREEEDSPGTNDRGTARGGAASSDLPEDYIVDPRDVMHEDLATFYLEAAAATKVSRCTPFYRLHRICNSKISNVNIFWGARRGDLPKPGEIVEFMGTAVATESVFKDLEAVIRARYFRDRDMLNKGSLSSLRKSTVQVDVDVLCSETFFVVDDRTEQVVQGSKAVGSRTHRLRLECCPILNRDFRWTAVDLDVWMKGNTFW